MKDSSHHLTLEGCRPEPLLFYLKSLGVMRLIADQADPGVRAAWRGECFELHTALDRSELLAFFLDRYEPSPILSPWNRGSGFWETQSARTPHRALKQILASDSPRLKPLASAIHQAHEVMQHDLGFDIDGASEKQNKKQVIQALRSRLSDRAVQWLDSVAVLTADGIKYPPLLGTGGNDGRLEFTANFYQRLAAVLPVGEESDEEHRDRSRRWLELAVWGESPGDATTPLMKAAVGQFHPGGVGGPNATEGFEADSVVNPWDFVLAYEGALVFASAAARREGAQSGQGYAAVPFTSRPTAGGYASAVGSEEFDVQSGTRAEVWLPLWSHPASYREVAHLFAEGRAQLGRRQARSGQEFARAAASLGVDRGIDEFRRFGFIQRSGRSYIATPLSRVRVQLRPRVQLLDELDPWLEPWRRAARGDDLPARYRSVLQRVDRSILDFCSRGGTGRLQMVLRGIGRAERTLATSPPKLREGQRLRPLQLESPEWVAACDDGSATYRLAVSIASIWGQGEVGRLRSYLEPVERAYGRYQWTDQTLSVSWGAGKLADNLASVLERRCLDGRRAQSDPTGALPLGGWMPAEPADVQQFLEGSVDDERLTDLLWALSCLEWTGEAELPSRTDIEEPLPAHLARPYALLKLLFLSRPLGTTAGEEIRIRPEPTILRLLRARRIADACEVAIRRLRASGLPPLGTGRHRPGRLPQFHLPSPHRARIGGALLVPVRRVSGLARLVLKPTEAQPLRFA